MNERPLALACRSAIAGGDDSPAIDFAGQWYTRAAFNALARRIVALIDDVGVGSHPRVALAARNRPATLAALLALLARGCTVRMVYPFQSAEALAAELAAIGPEIAILTQEDIAAPVTAALTESGSALMALSTLDAQLVDGFEHSSAGAEPDAEPALVLLTSGTTGKPKPFALRHDVVARYYAGDAQARATPVNADASDVPAFLYFPVGNISGLYTTLPALLAGQRIVLLDRFSLDAWLAFVRRYRPTVFGMPPAAYRSFMALNVDPDELNSIRAMGSGAAPLDPAVKEAFEARYGIPILMSYGATEFGGPVTRMTPQMHAQIGATKRGTVGKAMEGMQIRVVDPGSGEPVPTGTQGIVEVVSCRIGPEWIRTSDLGSLDADGFLYLHGRADGAIVRGGFKLVPAVIESALALNPAVAAAAVVAVDDARLGQVPGAVVTLKADAEQSIADLEADLRKRVPATHIPVHWRIVEALPTTPSFKIDIAALKEMF